MDQRTFQTATTTDCVVALSQWGGSLVIDSRELATKSSEVDEVSSQTARHQHQLLVYVPFKQDERLQFPKAFFSNERSFCSKYPFRILTAALIEKVYNLLLFSFAFVE
jgi:hypothetical protein